MHTMQRLRSTGCIENADERAVALWSLMLLSGLINVGLAYLIWKGWPNTASWIIGLYVGIDMIFFLGLPLIMTAVAARNIGEPTTPA
jgi:uncharacterized membrane protein HdeD (DUF308 family)